MRSLGPQLAALACLLGIVGCDSVSGCAATAQAGQASFLERAAFVDGRLWLLTDTGVLSTIVEGESHRDEAELPDPVVDLCVRGGDLIAVTRVAAQGSDWTLRRWHGGRWSIDGIVPAADERLVGMACTPERVTLVTSARLVDASRDRLASVPLSVPLDPGTVAAVYATEASVYVGINAGEWGGGLRRIDRRTGELTVIERNASGELCGGPLNTDCDPVNGIARVPWKPDCIAAAVGLVHFAPSGRIVEVCDDRVESIYFKRWREGGSADAKPGGDDRSYTVAFFGLARVGDELWAPGIDGVYRIRRPGAADTTSLPEFDTIGGIAVSFDLPNVILVLTDINQRRSISGSVPLLVPR